MNWSRCVLILGLLMEIYGWFKPDLSAGKEGLIVFCIGLVGNEILDRIRKDTPGADLDESDPDNGWGSGGNDPPSGSFFDPSGKGYMGKWVIPEEHLRTSSPYQSVEVPGIPVAYAKPRYAVKLANHVEVGDAVMFNESNLPLNINEIKRDPVCNHLHFAGVCIHPGDKQTFDKQTVWLWQPLIVLLNAGEVGWPSDIVKLYEREDADDQDKRKAIKP